MAKRVLMVRELVAGELGWANVRYAGIGFVPSSARDFVVVAELQGEKVGLGRLVPLENDCGELGGIYVLPQFRGRQVARSIVSFLISRSPFSSLYCIPFRRLESFYRSFGFVDADNDHDIPIEIADKVRWCKGRYQDQVSLLARKRGEIESYPGAA